MRTLALMICLLMIVPTLAGCFTEETNNNINQDDEWWNTPVHERENMELNMTGWRSQLPVDGEYSWSGPTEHFVEVDLPLSEQDVGYPGPALMHVSLWMPEVPNGTKVPVIATIHPY